MKKSKGTKLGQWQGHASRGGICGKCKIQYPTLTVDHIIPSFFLQQIGLIECVYEDEENFELLCKGCNGMKASKMEILHPKAIPLLKKYIALVESKYLK